MNKVYRGLAYTTVVNEFYLPILDKLIETHQKFSKIDLYVYTINFDITDREYSNIKFIKCTDDHLLDYEKEKSTIIKDNAQKHKYNTTLKPKFLSNFIDDVKYYFFVDCDILFTRFSDTLFINSIEEFGDTKIPISTKFFHQYCNNIGSEVVFDKDGKFNKKSLTYKPLCDLNKEEPIVIDYLNTFCVYYTNKCGKFFNEVDKICTSIFENGLDCWQYLPLGDETAFNYLYSKNNFTKYLSSFTCYNLPTDLDIKIALKNITLLNTNSIVSFIHTKRFTDGYKYEGDVMLNNKDYDDIFKVLCYKNKPLTHEKINIVKHHKDYNNNIEVINFTPNEDLLNISIKLINHKSQIEDYHQMNLKKDLYYFISRIFKKGGSRGSHGVIYKMDEIIDVFRVI
jgi:hypothetical protein